MKRESGDESYVNHLVAEHRRLNQLIHRTLRAIPNWADSGTACWSQLVVGGLAAVRQELAQHFAEEEEGGCLEEAVARCPALASQADQVQAEHGCLLQILDELIGHCRQIQRPTSRDLLGVEQELRAVAHKLHLHEAEENHIMERAFSVCLEQGDASLNDEQPFSR
jgi:hemerythrin-like domain-containing protein